MKQILFVATTNLQERNGGALATLAYYNAFRHLYGDMVDLALPAEFCQGNFAAALQNFAQEQTPTALYNQGNALAKSGKLEEAIKKYEEVLKLEPNHEDAKFNLEYLKQQQQQNQQNQQQNQSQNQDQQQNQQQQNQQQQNQQQNQQQSQNQQQQNQQAQAQSADKKKQEAERILRALENQEKNTLDKLKKEREQGGGGSPEKDW